MFDFIKEKHRKRVIRNLKALPRNKRIDNIQGIMTIGIICRLDDEQNWNILNQFAKIMENRGKTVNIIALQENRINFCVTNQSTTICRSKSNFNFWGIPSRSTIKKFTSTHYDLLIDTIGGQNFFSLYIALRTNASLKVVHATPAEDPTEIFDLIIRDDGQMDLKNYFNNIIKFLEMIKK